MERKLVVLLLWSVVASVVPVVVVGYVNPVLNMDFPDPCVIRAPDGFAYAYATRGNNVNIQVARSNNLVAWQWLGDALPQKPSWANQTENFWAPDVTAINSTHYVMFYAGQLDVSLNMCIGVAWSKSPTGPFKDIGRPILCDTAFRAIDPKLIKDHRGRWFLFWGSDFQPIRVQQLEDNLVTFKQGTKPLPVVQPSNTPYEALVEAAWVQRHNGYYYLYYSGDNCCGANAHYAVMSARAKEIEGPWEKLTPSPIILQLNSRFYAPGHNSVATDNAGQDWIFYHSIDSRNADGGERRVLMMDRIDWNSSGWPYIPPNGTPTNTSQPNPTI